MKKLFLTFTLLAAAMLFPAGVQAQSSFPPTTAPKTVTKSAPKTTFSAQLRAQITGGLVTGVNFTWNYVPNAPACGTATTNCYSGFTLVDTTAGITVATPTTLGPAALSYSYTPTGGMFFGSHTFSIVANGFNATGGALVSAATTTVITNGITTLNGPTGLSGILQ